MVLAEFVVRQAVMTCLFYVLALVALCYNNPHNNLNSIDDMVYGLNDAIRRPIMFDGHVCEKFHKDKNGLKPTAFQ